MARLTEKNVEETAARIELIFDHAKNSKSLGSRSLPSFKLRSINEITCVTDQSFYIKILIWRLFLKILKKLEVGTNFHKI